MSKEDIKVNKQRLTFSKKIKRKVLLEIIKGEKPTKALLKHTSLTLEEISSDKKYAAKLIYKWKQEAYKNREMLFLLNHELDEEMIDEEIANLGSDDEEEIDLEEAIEELKNEFLKLGK